MIVTPVSRFQFDAFNLPTHLRAPAAPDDELAWYADSTARLLGVIFIDRGNDCWGYALCERQRNGRFRRIALGMDFKHLGRAEIDLVTAMERRLAKDNAEKSFRRYRVDLDAVLAEL
jgi:hypothetical protein